MYHSDSVGDDNQNIDRAAAPSARAAKLSTKATKLSAITTARSPDGKNANDVDDGEIVIKFDPSDVDVVSTKIRTWNARHPGNIYYTELVAEAVSSGKDLTSTSTRAAAQRIYEVLTVQRGGRFLKLPERVSTSDFCTLLTPKRCVEKIIHAIKTAMHRSEREKGLTQLHTKEKKITDVSGHSKVMCTKPKSLTGKIKSAESTTKLPPKLVLSSLKKNHQGSDKALSRASTAELRSVSGDSSPNRSKQSLIENTNRLALLPFSVAYEAVAGNQPIHWYGLKAVSAVCSQSDPWTAFQALDVPCGGYTIETEPERERLMRLQVSPLSPVDPIPLANCLMGHRHSI